MQLKSLRVADVQLYAPGLALADRAFTGVAAIESVDDAIRASIARYGDGAVAVIPEGPYVIPHAPA
jgi:hypothetical protein